MNRNNYFRNMKIAMKLSDICIICGEEGLFHIDDSNEAKKIFKNDETPLCKKCATKLARKILEGIDF